MREEFRLTDLEISDICEAVGQRFNDLKNIQTHETNT